MSSFDEKLCDRLESFVKQIEKDLKSRNGLSDFLEHSDFYAKESQKLILILQREIRRSPATGSELRDFGNCDYTGVLFL